MATDQGLDDAVQPDVVINVRGEDAENFELEPVTAVHDDDEPERENGAGGERVDGIQTDANSEEGQKKGEAGDDLGVVAKGVDDHDHGDKEEEDEVDPLRVNDARVRHEMHRVSDEKGEGPSAANERAGEDTVAIAPFKVDAGAENEKADEIPESDFCGIAERRKFVGEEKRDTDDEGDDAEFVEPVFAEGFFDLGTEFSRGGGRRLRWQSERWRGGCGGAGGWGVGAACVGTAGFGGGGGTEGPSAGGSTG